MESFFKGISGNWKRGSFEGVSPGTGEGQRRDGDIFESGGLKHLLQSRSRQRSADRILRSFIAARERAQMRPENKPAAAITVLEIKKAPAPRPS